MLALVLAQCFVIGDGTPGWKQVTLPSDAPQLAADEGVPQFRPADPVIVVHDTEQVFRSTRTSSLGTHEFQFALPPNARTLRVEFARPLDGAKVDAVLEGPRGRMAVMDEKRTSGARLELLVSLPDASKATLSVHSHLRGAPTLQSAEVERELTPAHSPEFTPQLTVGHSLYVLKGPGPLTVCQRPGQALRVRARELRDAQVTSALLTRQPR